MIFLFLLSFYIYYYQIKLHLYLKKHRSDLLNYVSDGEIVEFSDLFRYDKMRKAFQRGKNWYFGDVGEEDETIKYYKKRLKISYKIGYILLALILILIILLFARAQAWRPDGALLLQVTALEPWARAQLEGWENDTTKDRALYPTVGLEPLPRLLYGRPLVVSHFRYSLARARECTKSERRVCPRMKLHLFLLNHKY